MDNERTYLISEVIRYAAALIGATSAGARKRARRGLVSMALMVAVEAGDDLDALVAEARRNS